MQARLGSQELRKWRLFRTSCRDTLPPVMAADSPIVLEGMLKSDGTLELWSRPALPPGRVWVTLQAALAADRAPEILPDPPSPEESVPAPFDLPLPHPAEPVETQKVAELLPDPFQWTAADTRP